MSAPRSVANMFPYRFPAPVVPGSVAARPAVPSSPAFSFPFRSLTSRPFLPRSSPPRSSPPRSFPPKSFPPRSFRTVRFALRSSDDLFPALSRVLPETTRSRPKLSDKPSYGGSRAPARPRRRRSSQLLGGLFSSAPRRASPGLDTSVGVQNLVPRSVPTPRSCGKSVTNAESFEQFRGREVTACGGIFPDFATVLHGFGTRIGPDLSGAEICGCNPKFIPTNRPSSVPQGLSPFQIRPLPSVKRRQGFTIPNREL